MPLPSSTVMTPSLPTFSIAWAMISPMVSSLLAEIAATCATALPSTGFAISWIALDAFDGLLDAALDRHRVGAGGDAT